MRYACKNMECGNTFINEDYLPEDMLCPCCGYEIDELVVCEWCGNDVARWNTENGICEECWEREEERILKELFNK